MMQLLVTGITQSSERCKLNVFVGYSESSQIFEIKVKGATDGLKLISEEQVLGEVLNLFNN